MKGRARERGRRRSWQSAALVLVALVLAATDARAQGNALSAPTGGRSALMGNTGVALSRDGSAPFLNPATIVRINDNSLAFSVNFYTFQSTHFSGWHQPGPVDTSQFGDVALGGTSISSNNFRIFPSTLCLFFTIHGVTAEGANDNGLHSGRQKLAVCFGTTEFQDVVLPSLPFSGNTPAGSTTQTQSLALQWNRFQAGPTYSISFSDDFAVGASLHGVYTSESFLLDSTSITSVTSGGAVQSALGAGTSAHAIDLALILGAAYHRGNVTLGASVQVPSLHVFGQYSATLHSEYGLSGTDNATLSSGTGSFVAPTPIRFSLGAGAEWQRLVLEVDGSLQLPVASIESSVNGSTTTLTGTAATTAPFSAYYTIPQVVAFNAAVGGEYFLSKGFSLLGGASTSLTTLPALSPTMTVGNLVQSRTSSATLSFGIGSYGGGADLLIGTQLGYIWGQSIAADPYALPNDWAVVGTHAYSVTFILAGATDLRSIGRAVEKVENAVTNGSPEVTPAGPGHPGEAPPKPCTRELPRSGPTDPRNQNLDTTPPPPNKPPPAPDGGAPPQEPQKTPSSPVDPQNRTFPPR
ncbi:MAG TPA: hypothetical protein VGL81_16655 [Polyangiaceae bacterium]|jgi:hypothetical protein